jgi:hypothetical protein
MEQQKLLFVVKGVMDLHVFGGTVAMGKATINKVQNQWDFREDSQTHS